MNCKNIVKLVNALGKPYCGASVIYKNKTYKVWSAKETKFKIKTNNIEYGKVIKKKKKSYIIKCIDGLIEIKNIQPNLNLSEGQYL